MIEVLKQALDVIETAIKAGDWKVDGACDPDKAISRAKKALAQTQEPVAWRTFDGEGGYDYHSYEDNESYADDWNKRNPNHKGWVDKLYTRSQPKQEPEQMHLPCIEYIRCCTDKTCPKYKAAATPRLTWVGLTDEEIEYVWRKVETSDFHDCVLLFAKELEAKLKEKNS